ncbi:MAG: hypothetical protein HY437_00455 [Candidatus Magasanikbacteria bacterium]|nr:hypothetical protein [Candidatus Magasanikbacteria bacterium]
MPSRRPSSQRLILGVILPLFLFANMVAIGVGIPKKVFAQGLPVIDAAQVSISVTDNILDYLLQVLLDALTGAAVGGVLQLGKYFVGQFAASLKSGGAGQTPLFHNTTYGTFLIDAGAEAAISFLDSLGKNQLANDVSDPAVRLAIQYGLRDVMLGKGNITNSEFGKVGDAFENRWEKVQEKYGGCAVTANNASQNKSLKGLLGQQGGIEDCMMALTKDVFKPANTEVGVSLRSYNQLYGTMMGAAQSALLERQEGKGFKGVESQIAGYLKTPAALVADEAKQLTSVVQEERMFQLLSGVLGSGSKTALGSALGAYGSSMVSKLGKSVIDGLFEVKKPAKRDFALGGGLQDAGGAAGLQTSISAGFARALTETVAIRDAGLFDTLSQFASCPSESGRINRTPDECIIDGEFESAVRRAEGGAPLTIGEAIKAGLLHANWKLVPPADEGLNASTQCRTQAYCHANIAKLRLARILPLGFEIAAALSPGGQDSWTLGQVVEGFHSCQNGGRDAAHPYCHLIDPNWILKAPLTRCTAEVPGPMLAMSGVATRHNICVNKPTCLQDDGSGECVSPWGYCMREKNIWRFTGEMCSAQFATCTTYRGASAGAAESVSYLARTIDFGRCTEQDTGCKKYAVRQQDVAGEGGAYAWKTSVVNPVDPAIYLNAKATTCNQPGCTEFKRADGSSVHLKKAPLYMHCYDSNRDTQGVIDWPRTVADIALISKGGWTPPREECKQHAPVCAMDEVGCTRYTPESGDPAIPAITTAGDRCPTECAGYSAYKQLPVTFEEARFPLYFIPTTAGACTAEQVGCEQFVNLATEKLEYYSFVRQCEKPAEGNNAIFYAWEGSDLQGYQLRSYVLKTDAGNIPGHGDDPFINVKPVYAAMYNEELMESYHAACNKELYAGKLADPDCRELFDRDGNTFYRLLSKTVTVASECNALRKTDAYLYAAPRELIGNANTCASAKGQWDAAANVCRLCAGGGENRDGICIYSVIAKEATTCPAQAAGCRAYTGNAGNNVRVAYQALFDTLDASAWSDGELSAESVKVGDKSLKVSGASTQLSIPLAAQSSYTMTFWAKGIGTLAVQFNDTEFEARASDPFRLTGDWRQFAIGPVYIKSLGEHPRISFTIQGNNNLPLFLDNVVVKETIATVNLVKDSWQTPASCDANPRDNIPGAMLGCQAYKDHSGAAETFKSFTRICRDAAVGCEELTDTFNTASASGTTFMVRCGERSRDTIARGTPENPGSRGCTPVNLDVNNDGAVDALDQKEVCTVPLGQDYCTFTLNRALARDDAHFNAEDTIVVPEDSKAYLVNLKEYQCDTGQKGCSELGETTGTAGAPTVSSVSKLNDPEKYGEILCTADVVGCAAYQVTSQVGGERTVYFRDPAITGKPVCEYRDKVKREGQVDASGWFKTGTDTSCYDNFLEAGARYGVWSYGDAPYTGNVAACPTEQNTCTEFRDPADTSQLYPEGQPYYVLDDGKLDRTSCKGQVSLKEGCILFKNGSDPAKSWNASSTYKRSGELNGAPTTPVQLKAKDTALDCTIDDCVTIAGIQWPQDFYPLPNAVTECKLGYQRRFMPVPGQQQGAPVCIRTYAANTILKVVRDRACGEWLACRGSQTVLDKTTNQPKTACSDVALCNEFSQGTDRFEECTNWVITPENDNLQLNENIYARRKVGWYDMEYSGFSLFDQYQIFDYKFVKRNDGEVRLVAVPWAYDAAKQACVAVAEGENCSIGRTSGRCFGGLCTQGIGPLGRLAPQCRGYASPEAPFSFVGDQVEWEVLEKSRNGNDILTTSKVKSFKVSGFDRSNICQQGNTCQCTYQKITYGDGNLVRFFDEKWDPDENLPRGFCQGGFNADSTSKTGRLCTSSVRCRDERELADPDRDRRDGECILRTQVSKHRGWQGFCLETDGSIRTPGSGINGRPCLTWMPLDNPPGLESLENAEEAGYVVAAGEAGKYCVESVGNAVARDGVYTYQREFDTLWAQSAFDNDGCPDWAARTLLTMPNQNNGQNGVSYFAGRLFSDVDHIEIKFLPGGAQAPTAGSVHIVNDGIETPGVGGNFLGKPRIYGSDEQCKEIAVITGIISTLEPTAAERSRYVCITPGGQNAPNGHRGMTFIKEHGGKKYLVFMWYAHGDGAGSSLIRGINVPVVMGNLFYGSLRDNKFGDYVMGGECGNHSDGGAIAYVVGADGRFEDKFKVALYNRNTYENLTMIASEQRVVAREICKDAVQVVNSDQNAAWTNRLWSQGPAYSIGGGNSVITRATPVAPFGGIAPLADTDDESLIQRSTFGGGQLVKGGALFSCPGGRCGIAEVNNAAWPRSGLNAGIAALKELFGKAYKVAELDDAHSAYAEQACPAGNNAACYDERRNLPRPPRIASLDMNNCKITGVGEANNCGLGKLDRMTIDGKDEGIVFGNGYRNIVLRFFGWADTDRMPIRNITVDWDFDNRITGGNPGKFKNKKTRCSTGTPASHCGNDINITCSNDAECSRNGLLTCLEKRCSGGGALKVCIADADCIGNGRCVDATKIISFGNSSDACDKGFHEFFGSYNFQPDDTDHCNYTVGTNNPAGVTTAQLTSNGLSFGDRYCAFKPRVIIIDNWGWCNGTCGNGGCWNEEQGVNFHQCEDSARPGYQNSVGTKFGGWIIVAEQK